MCSKISFRCGSLLLFTANVDREDICDMKLDKETAAEFEVAVDQQVCIYRVNNLCDYLSRFTLADHLSLCTFV